MAELVDVLNSDAFSLANLTTSFTEMDYVPGRVSELLFGGVGEGVRSQTIYFETDADSINVIPSAARGTPVKPENRPKRRMESAYIPHFPLDDVIQAAEVSGVRAMGQEDAVKTVESHLNRILRRISLKHDMTLENIRMGSVLGKTYDADGSEMTDWFAKFNKAENAPIDFDLANDSTELRTKCHEVIRLMTVNAKGLPIPNSARPYVLCGHNFFDALMQSPDVKEIYTGSGTERAERVLGDSYAYGVFEFGGLLFEDYRGSDNNDASNNTEDGGGVGIDPDEARVFWFGVPGMFEEYYAPGDFIETADQVGAPRYASVKLDPMHGRFIDIHTEQNVINFCTRPKTLLTLTAT